MLQVFVDINHEGPSIYPRPCPPFTYTLHVLCSPCAPRTGRPLRGADMGDVRCSRGQPTNRTWVDEATPQTAGDSMWPPRAHGLRQRPYIRETMHPALNLQCTIRAQLISATRGCASQPKVLAMATDCSATCQQGYAQPR